MHTGWGIALYLPNKIGHIGRLIQFLCQSNDVSTFSYPEVIPLVEICIYLE
ncbi:Uncharacterised protein [Prevotella denticola]|uniref:Uncharacterized protein n=1 Tax=Prevotella denticola TaxID=28129 RepID=A0A379E271_9BACT|nr:Uncharacterised protein [Prevotella denticola]